MTIKAITFDFWSTLYRSKNIDFTARLVRLKKKVETASGTSLPLEQFQQAVEDARDTWRRLWIEEHRTILADEWLQLVLETLQIELSPEHIFEIKTGMENSVLDVKELPTLLPDAKTAVAELSENYRLGIISDTGITPGRVLRQLLEKDGIINYFSHLTFSDEVGCSKPHPDAFLTTLQALEAKPEEAVHVGDLLRTDIAGAQNAGMRAVQYIGINHDTGELSALPPQTIITPDAIIENHSELSPLLKRW